MGSLIKKLAIGSAQFGQKYGISNKHGIVKPKDVHEILNLADKNGIDTIDTAKAYGKSENVLGQYIREKKTKWKIISKYDNYHEGIKNQILKSAKLLNTYPQTVLAHNIDLFMDSKFQLEIQQLRNEGLINKVGVSIYSKKEIDIVLQSKLKPEVVQLPINILDTRLYFQNYLKKLVDKKIQIHARSVFLQGLFYLSKSELKEKFKDVTPVLEKLRFAARKNNLSIAELSLSWVSSLDCISKIIVGVASSKQLSSHISLLKKEKNQFFFQEALSLKYQNKNILNPSLW